MEARNTTQHVVSRTGAERQGHIFSFQSREKNVLDLSSYRPGISDNAGAVKYFLSVLTRALRGARHFALVEVCAIPT